MKNFNEINRASMDIGAKKKFKLFKTLLVAIGLLATGLTTPVMAADVCKNAIIYFDNTASDWNSAYHYFTINDTHGWKMKKVTNTKLYVHKRTENTWTGYSYIRLVAFSSNWGEGEVMGGFDNFKNLADAYTNTYNNFGFGAVYYYYVEPAGSSYGSLSVGTIGSAADLTPINGKVITVGAKVSTNNGGSYSEATSPGTLSASSHEFSDYETCDVSTSLSDGTISCGYRATTTLTAEDVEGYVFEGWYNSSGTQETSSNTLIVYPKDAATYYAYYRKLYSISAGTTVVWDKGNTEASSGVSNWTNVYLRRYVEGAPSYTEHDQLTHLGSSSQYAVEYNSVRADIRSFMFRSGNDDESWSDNQQTTNIFRDIDGITIFTYCQTATHDEGNWKLNWQVTPDGKKGAEGKTIYFDDSKTEWGGGSIYFNYGVDWDGDSDNGYGYHRKIDFASTKVPGTESLYKLVASSSEATNQGATDASGQFAHDIYFQKWYVSKSYGYTNRFPITDSHVLERTAIYTDEIVSNDFTLIPTEPEEDTGSGTDGSVKEWVTSRMIGHTHTVTLSAIHGTITLTYTDENDDEQNPTVTTNVAHTCKVSASASAATGYKNPVMTVGGESYTADDEYIVRSNVTFAATFTPKSCTIKFNDNGGEGGSVDKTATYDAAMPALSARPHRIGYKFDGYYDGVGGTGNKYYEADGSSAANWNKNTEEETTLYAKWLSDRKTFKEGVTSSWTTTDSWTGGVPENDYSSVTINGVVTLSTPVHIGELAFGDDGKLIIAPTGTLAVAGTITNTDVGKIVINTSDESQGALIYDIETPPYATVNVTLDKTSGNGFQYIASPVGAVSVSSVFAGTGAYTYAWIEGKGWERRGYYDDFGGDEVVLISGKSGCYFSGQLNPTYSHSITCTADPENEKAQGVNMIPNTLTAPIRIAKMKLTNSDDGAVHIWNDGGWEHYAVSELKAAEADDVIPALQGYAVIAKGSGSVSFDYDAAVRGAASHNDALRAPKRTTTDTPKYMKIFVTTNERKIGMRLSEHEQFSNEIDNGWEALYMEGDGRFGELYAQAAKQMSILAIDNLEGTVLGFAPGQAENYTISFEGDGRGYYLNDVKKEEATLIVEGNTYTFTADESTNATRFVISKTPIAKTPTSVENLNDGVKARKQLIDGALYIIRDGKLYNATGVVVK